MNSIPNASFVVTFWSKSASLYYLIPWCCVHFQRLSVVLDRAGRQSVVSLYVCFISSIKLSVVDLYFASRCNKVTILLVGRNSRLFVAL